MSLSANAMPGYTVIPKANQMLAERNETVINKFEVFDLKNMSKTDLLVSEDKTEKQKPQKRAKKNINKVIKLNNVHNINEQEDEHTEAVSITPYTEIVFITPYTEISINALEFYIDKNVFSIITSSDDRVKVRPNRGIELSAKVSEKLYNLYSSGVYIPISKMNAVLSVFFIVDENTEP